MEQLDRLPNTGAAAERPGPGDRQPFLNPHGNFCSGSSTGSTELPAKRHALYNKQTGGDDRTQAAGKNTGGHTVDVIFNEFHKRGILYLRSEAFFVICC